MAALLTYFGAHWTLAIATTLGVVALFGAAYIFRSFKLAVAGVVVAAMGFIYQGAVTDGIKIQLQKDAAAHIRMLESHIDAINKTAEENAARAKEDADKIVELERQASETPKNSSACFDADTTRRVFNIK
jgi:hypothetical protein